MANPVNQKEALFIVVDVSASMRPHLDETLDALRTLINVKLLFHKSDAVGVALHGTEETRNEQAAEIGDGSYEHIALAQQMAPVTYDTIAALDLATSTPAGGSADLIDSLVLGMDAVINFVKKLKYGKKVLFVTDGTSPASVDDEQFGAIAQQLSDSQINFEVIGISLEPPAEPPADPEHAAEAEAKQHTLSVLRRFEEALGDRFCLRALADTRGMQGALRKRASRPSKDFTGPLAIGSILGLPIVAWRKVVEAAKPKWVSVSKNALEQGADSELRPEQSVLLSRTHYVDDPSQAIPPDQHVKAYRFGKDLVPLSELEAGKIKFGVESKCLQLLGLVPQAEVPRHYLIGRPLCVVSNPEASPAHRALQAFLLGLEEEGLVGVARYAPKKGAPPVLVALTPTFSCLWLHKLPYAEDVKAFDWGPPPQLALHSAEQQAAADALVDALDLTAVEGKPRAVEPLRPKAVYNPKLQRAYQCIMARARGDAGGGSHLPEPDWRVTAPLKPDPELFAPAAAAIERFATALPVADAPPRAGAKRGYGGEDLGGKKARPAAPPAVLPEADSKPGGGGGALLLQQAVPSAVDSADPIGSFRRMAEYEPVRVGEPYLVDKAMLQMGGVVRELLGRVAGPSDEYADKAVECLKEMRRGGKMYDEPEPFNALLRGLKPELQGGANGMLWRRIAADPKLGLLTAADTEESEVSAAEAAAFAAVEETEQAADGAKPTAEPEPTEEETAAVWDDLE